MDETKDHKWPKLKYHILTNRTHTIQLQTNIFPVTFYKSVSLEEARQKQAEILRSLKSFEIQSFTQRQNCNYNMKTPQKEHFGEG